MKLINKTWLIGLVLASSAIAAYLVWESLQQQGPGEVLGSGGKVLNLVDLSDVTELSQAILHRGAGLEVVWPLFLALLVICGVLFSVSLARFRKTIGQLA